MTKMNMKEAEQHLLDIIAGKRMKRVIDYRYPEEEDFYTVETVVMLVNEDEEITREDLGEIEMNAFAVGRAFCSRKDNYNKKKGRLIATARAIENLNR